MQNVCVQFDVDMFELTAAIATGGGSALPTPKVLPFKTVISFALNLEVCTAAANRRTRRASVN